MKNHKVSQTKYEEVVVCTQKHENKCTHASGYSGIISVGGGFSIDKEQRSAASNFQKSVQSRTIVIGAALPSNGDAFYSLLAIHNLFTERYSKHLPKVSIDIVRKTLINASKIYCQALKDEGRVGSCDDSIHLGTSLNGVG